MNSIDLSNIKITGSKGSSKPEETLTQTITTNGTQTFNPTSGHVYDKAVITTNVQPTLQIAYVTPQTSAQAWGPDPGYDGFDYVDVEAVTSSIDSNITAGNIKKDVTILGVSGSYDPQPVLQSKTATPTTSSQSIIPDSGYDALSSVTVDAVTSSIDANITAGNIKKDVAILGVTGTYEGGGSEPTYTNVVPNNFETYQLTSENNYIKPFEEGINSHLYNEQVYYHQNSTERSKSDSWAPWLGGPIPYEINSTDVKKVYFKSGIIYDNPGYFPDYYTYANRPVELKLTNAINLEEIHSDMPITFSASATYNDNAYNYLKLGTSTNNGKLTYLPIIDLRWNSTTVGYNWNNESGLDNPFGFNYHATYELYCGFKTCTESLTNIDGILINKDLNLSEYNHLTINSVSSIISNLLSLETGTTHTVTFNGQYNDYVLPDTIASATSKGWTVAFS